MTKIIVKIFIINQEQTTNIKKVSKEIKNLKEVINEVKYTKKLLI